MNATRAGLGEIRASDGAIKCQPIGIAGIDDSVIRSISGAREGNSIRSFEVISRCARDDLFNRNRNTIGNASGDAVENGVFAVGITPGLIKRSCRRFRPIVAEVFHVPEPPSAKASPDQNRSLVLELVKFRSTLPLLSVVVKYPAAFVGLRIVAKAALFVFNPPLSRTIVHEWLVRQNGSRMPATSRCRQSG